MADTTSATSSTKSEGYSSTSSTSIVGLGSGIEYDKMVESIMKNKNKLVENIVKEQDEITEKLDLYKNFREKLQGVQDAAKELRIKSNFDIFTSSSTHEGLATITPTANATQQMVDLTVSNTALANKIRSQAFTSITATLNSGSIVINGKGITSSGSDTISEFVGKINEANCGAEANLLSDGAGNYYIVIASSKTGGTDTSKGTNNAIQICNVSGGTLLTNNAAADFDMLSGTLAIRTNVTDTVSNDTACSIRFTSKDTAIQTLMGPNATLPSGTVTIGGQNVAIDLTSESLETIRNNINAAGGNCTATINELTENGTTTYALYITRSGTNISTGDFTDTSNILEILGVLQSGYDATREVVSATNASVTIDGVSISNQYNDLDNISGATISLHGLSTFTNTKLYINRDFETITGKVSKFVDEYNELVEYIKEQTKWDPEMMTGGPLLGEQLVATLPSDMNQKVFATLNLDNTTLKNLTNLGVNFDLDSEESGKLKFDEGVFNQYLKSNITDTRNLFTEFGIGSVNTIEFISAGSNTIESSSGYAVNITAAATKATATAGTAQTTTNAGAEQLTFTFHGKSYTVSLATGNSRADNITAINSHDTVGRYVYAEDSGSNEIKLTSKFYGSKGDFSVVSDTAAAASSSGIGTTTVTVSGTDVAGTINAETCTGDGQYLVGNSAQGIFGSAGYTAGNTNTDALKIKYTGSSTGAVGTIKYYSGAFNGVFRYLDSVLQSQSYAYNRSAGTLTAMEESLKEQFNELESRRIETRLRLIEEERQLTERFRMMDANIGKYSSQSAQLSSMMGALKENK